MNFPISTQDVDQGLEDAMELDLGSLDLSFLDDPNCILNKGENEIYDELVKDSEKFLSNSKHDSDGKGGKDAPYGRIYCGIARGRKDLSISGTRKYRAEKAS